MKKARPGPEEPRFQYAALPWRRDGEVEIMLVSSRETRRWVVPKGWPMKGRKPFAAAEREALEEAGVTGDIAKTPIGAYHYDKRHKNGSVLTCEVKVFPLRVRLERKTWREKHERVRKWFPAAETAAAVDEEELREIILEFGAALRKSESAPSS